MFSLLSVSEKRIFFFFLVFSKVELKPNGGFWVVLDSVCFVLMTILCFFVVSG